MWLLQKCVVLTPEKLVLGTMNWLSVHRERRWIFKLTKCDFPTYTFYLQEVITEMLGSWYIWIIVVEDGKSKIPT